jgi:osmoprotectant transport system permease protein
VNALIAAAGPVIPDFGGGGASNACVRDNHFFCWSWFQDNWSSTFSPALLQHIEITVVALVLGFLIAFTAALLAFRFHWFETPFGLFAAFLYTVPSLALFQVLVGWTGLGFTTALIPIVTYTLLIIFRNTLIGLRDIPDEVREAARGMGFTRRQTLLRVELPLALPAMLGGLQIAAVTVVSLATIAAYVWGKGLGRPIFDAIGNGAFNTELVGAGVLAILLGVVAYLLLAMAQRLLAPWSRYREA